MSFEDSSIIRYRHPRLIAAIASLPDSLGPEFTDSLHREMMHVLTTNIPITFLFPQVQHIVAHKRVRGIESPFRSQPGMFAEYWWLEP